MKPNPELIRQTTGKFCPRQGQFCKLFRFDLSSWRHRLHFQPAQWRRTVPFSQEPPWYSSKKNDTLPCRKAEVFRSCLCENRGTSESGKTARYGRRMRFPCKSLCPGNVSAYIAENDPGHSWQLWHSQCKILPVQPLFLKQHHRPLGGHFRQAPCTAFGFQKCNAGHF